MKKIKSYTIGEIEEKLSLKISKSNGFKSASDYINWLIRKDNQNRNPTKALGELEREEEILNINIKNLNNKKDELRNKRKEIISQIDMSKKLQLEKEEKRPFAVQKITELLINQDILGAEQRARTWGFMLNINPSELMAEALVKRKESVYGQI